MSRYDRPSHRVFMTFFYQAGWQSAVHGSRSENAAAQDALLNAGSYDSSREATVKFARCAEASTYLL
jgi:hypothetical protein